MPESYINYSHATSSKTERNHPAGLVLEDVHPGFERSEALANVLFRESRGFPWARKP
jgi:hypothetical protein